jgi:hypothetical protein
MPRATKAAPTPRKATPARGHGKGTAKYDEAKHPRGQGGRFASKGGQAARTAKPKKTGTAKQRKGLADQIRTARAAAKTPEARKALLTQVRGLRQKRADWRRGQGKTRVEKLPKPSGPVRPPAKPKPPRKVGTAKQRKGLADQIRAARAGAKTPEARKALLGQVRDLRAKRSEWARGQGKKQVEPLPKPPKEPKPKTPKAPKEKTPRKEPKPKAPKPPKEPKAVAAKKAAADLRGHYASTQRMTDAQRHAALDAYLAKHQTPAVSVKVHSMATAEEMHSIPFDGYTLHYPKGDTSAVLKTVRAAELYAPLPKELTQHTKNVYLTKQTNKHDEFWSKQYNKPGTHVLATGGDGDVVIYRNQGVTSGVLAHEMGHNLATARYGDTEPYKLSDFAVATKHEAPPTAYAKTNSTEDFAESVMLYTANNAGLKRLAPKRHAVLTRMFKDPNYDG